MHEYEHLRVEQDVRGVVTVTIDAAGRRVNVLDDALLRELESLVGDLESDVTARLVVFRSGKETGFLAGADLRRIQAITAAGEADAVLKRGQDLLRRVGNLSAPTIAVIHGPCLGGGLEFALACDHRIARDDPATCLGLPETQLGLIPGWGGTCRLPRIVGLAEAVRLILDGTRVSAAEALRIGLIDSALDPESFDDGVATSIEQALGHGGSTPASRDRLAGPRDDLDAGEESVLRSAQRRVSGRAPRNPALPAALRAITAGLRGGLDAGLAAERDEFCRILFTPECRRLLEKFFQR